jgi:hypothetical protein
LETIIRWEKDVEEEVLAKALQFILLAKVDIDKIGEMTTPHLENILGHPQIIWATFDLENDIQ